MGNLLTRLVRLEAAAAVRVNAPEPIHLRPSITQGEWMAWIAAHDKDGSLASMEMTERIVASRGTPAWQHFMDTQTFDAIRPAEEAK